MNEEMTNETEVIEVKQESEEIQATPEPEEHKELEEHKKHKKRRRTEELEKIPVKSLSDAEKNRLIKHLKSELEEARTKETLLRQNTEHAIKSRCAIEEKQDKIEAHYITIQNYIEQQVRLLHTSIMLAIRGGISNDN